jgi:hypothetical protein
MKREDILLISLPFLLSAIIVFGHYKFLVSQNPQAHSKPLITTKLIQSLSESELEPVSPQASFPNIVVGAMHEIPTSRSQLEQLLNLIESQKANTLLLRVGMKISSDGVLILPQAAESSEETLLSWTKKTVSEAHKVGLHSYVALMFIEEPLIADPSYFSTQLKQLIERWASLAQEYHVTFFDPGITLGHLSYHNLPQDNLQIFVTEIEHKTREIYTGRIGIGVCCRPSNISSRGYNQLLLISNSGNPSQTTVSKALLDAKRFGIEHIYLLELDTRRLSTIL